MGNLKRLLAQRLPVLFYNFLVRIRLLGRACARYGFNPWALHLFWAIQPYTMVGHARLFHAFELAERAEKDDIEGAFVECGVWRGGCAALMAAVAARNRQERNTWLFDSFEGMPQPTEKDGAKAASYARGKTEGKLEPIQVTVGPLQDVENLLFGVLKLPRDYIRIVRGWFQDTLPCVKNEVGPIALLRLDADWYESTKCILENLYDKVVSGGYIIIDDYGSWEGCRTAVDEFFRVRGMTLDISWIDASGIYFKKP